MTSEMVLSEETQNILFQWIREVYPDKGLRHATYELTCEHADSLAVHAWGRKPKDLLSSNRPKEPADILDYRLAIWEPFTMSEWIKARNVVLRIFQPGQYGLKYSDERVPGVPDNFPSKSYFEDNFGGYYSLLNFTKDVLIQWTLADPNAVCAILPTPTPENEPIRYLPFIFGCHAVRYRDSEIMVLVAEEKSPVRVGNQIEYSGLTGWILTRDAIHHWKQVGEKKEPDFIIDHTTFTNLGEIPAFLLGGTVNSTNGAIWYSSMLAGVEPHWNKAVVVSSDYDGFLYRHLNPHLLRAQTPCKVCQGAGKVLQQNEMVKCRPCDGSGYVGIHTSKSGSPYQDTTFDIADLQAMGAKVSDLMQYVAPPTENFREFREEIENHIRRGFASVNMEVVADGTGSNQSGIAKSIDRQDLNSFLADCADHFFDGMEWIAWTITRLRYAPLAGTRWEELAPEIIRPRKFDYVTVDGILQEAKSAQEANLHQSIIRGLNIQAAGTIFGNESDDALLVKAQITLDPYEGMSDDKLLTMNAAGILNPVSLYVHANIATLVSEAFEKDKTFLKKPLSEQKKAIFAMAEKELAAKTDGGKVDTALLEAQAKLKGTVGGVQGIIALNAAVAKGEVAESAAESILVNMYGFGSEVARSLIEKGEMVTADDYTAAVRGSLGKPTPPPVE